MGRLKCIFLAGVAASLIFMRFSYIYAAPAYGTHMPRKGRWVWGTEGNFILDRNLDNDQGGINVNNYFLTGSYGIFDWFCFDGKIGAGGVDWKRTGNANLHYDTNFAGAYGFRIKGPGFRDAGIKTVAGFQHISVHPDARNQASVKHEAIIDEWQGSVLISKDCGMLVPYAGIRYGTVDFIKWKNETDRKRIKSEKTTGVVTGIDIWVDNTTKVNFEVTFVDGEEIAVGISRDF